MTDNISRQDVVEFLNTLARFVNEFRRLVDLLENETKRGGAFNR